MRNLSLSAKTFLLALLNLLLLALVFLAFLKWQFRFDLPTYLVTAASERIGAVSGQLALELEETQQNNWNALLEHAARHYPATFYVFEYTGKQLAGRSVQLPALLVEALRKDPFAAMDQRRHERRAEYLRDHPGAPRPEHLRFDRFEAMGRPPMPGPDLGAGGPAPDMMRNNSRLPLFRTDAPRRYWTAIRIPLNTQTGEHIHAAIIWETSSFWANPFFIDYRPWLVVLLAVLIVSALCWIPPIRVLTKAVTRLTFVTQQIADGHFDIVLPTKRRDELGVLSDSINRMAQRLSGYVYGQKRFLGDIAHELSSPIARIQVGLGILEQRADESQGEYLADVHEEVEHMSKLVGELLAFSKSQVKEQGVGLTPVSLNEVLERAIARESCEGVDIVVGNHPPLNVLGTSESLFRATANVLRNAVRYAGTAGPINISVHHAPGDKSVSVLIEDQGPGLPVNELENVFRPFYRPEFARQRETGGTGLGLAIVRDCVEACGGSVQARNRVPTGLQVEMRLQIA